MYNKANDPSVSTEEWVRLNFDTVTEEKLHELASLARLLADAGFTVLQRSVGSGLYLGIDGGGYSFLANHWVPLRAEIVMLMPKEEGAQQLYDLLLGEAERGGGSPNAYWVKELRDYLLKEEA